MLIQILLSFAYYLLAVGLMVFVHELGHISQLNKYDIFRSIEFDPFPFIDVPDDLAVNKKLLVFDAGVRYGFFVAVLFSLFNLYVAPAILLTYYFGCKHDLKTIMELKRKV